MKNRIVHRYSFFYVQLRCMEKKKVTGNFSELDCFLYYDEYRKESSRGKYKGKIMVNDSNLYFKDSSIVPFRRVVAPEIALETVLTYHIIDEEHLCLTVTQKSLKSAYLLIPDVILKEILSHCSCAV